VNLKAQLAALQKSMRDTVAAAKADGRDLTGDEISDIESKSAEAIELKGKIEIAEKSADLMKQFSETEPDAVDTAPESKGAATLGEHFAKCIGGQDGLLKLKTRGATIEAPEFVKANTDPNTVGSSFGAVLTDVDQSIVHPYRRPTVADLFGTGSINGTAVTYYVEGAVEGAFTTVAEGGQKPQIHIINPTPVTDKLTKIAAWFDNSDEMVEDLAFMVSEINNRGQYLLSLAEENQLLSGDGTGTNLTGLLNRSGVQTEAQAASNDNAQDTIFRALTKVQTATGLLADGIVINPLDYQALRLSKDANGQYFGGGFFSGEYGNGGVTIQPPLWGTRTVVSSAVPAKTVVVGAFKASTTVYRKGGVRVESTNSDAGKFTKNIITTRIEERLALAVRIPSATVKVTLQ
jgi:HK97 family phage major capsid protein